MPAIDNFKGNTDDEKILYDAILLEYQKDSIMKVLIYLKPGSVIYPSNKDNTKKMFDETGKINDDANTL